MTAALFAAFLLLVVFAVCARLDRRDAKRARREAAGETAAVLREARALFRDSAERADRSWRETLAEMRRFMDR